MAVAEGARIAPAGSAGASGSAGAPADYDRTPPQDVEAERSVLGAMMMSKDAIADVVEVIRPGDFYYPANQLIYDSIIDLYTRGDPADAITVSSELTRSGQLLRVGGGSYLHTLISTVPTAANAGYYAQIVAERAILRRLVTAGTRIVQMGYDTASGSVGVLGSVDDVVDRGAVGGLRGHRAAHVRGLRPHRGFAAGHLGRARTHHGSRRCRQRRPRHRSRGWTRSRMACTRAR